MVCKPVGGAEVGGLERFASAHPQGAFEMPVVGKTRRGTEAGRLTICCCCRFGWRAVLGQSDVITGGGHQTELCCVLPWRRHLCHSVPHAHHHHPLGQLGLQ